MSILLDYSRLNDSNSEDNLFLCEVRTYPNQFEFLRDSTVLGHPKGQKMSDWDELFLIDLLLR